MEKRLTGYASIDKPWLQYYSNEALNAPLPACTIYEYMHEKNSDNFSHGAIDYFGHKYTYHQMFRMIDKAVAAFASMGVKEGDAVSICSFTTPETIFSFYALNRLGALINIIEPRTNSTLIRDRINHTSSKLLIVIDAFLHKIEPVIDELDVEKIIIVGLSDDMPILKKAVYKISKGHSVLLSSHKAVCWRKFLKSGTTMPKDAPYKPGRPAAIIYTSGTTGVAKGAVFSDDSLTRLEQLCQTGNPRIYEGDRFMNIMPPFIAYGMFFGLFFVFCARHENILVPYCPPDQFARYFLKYKPNHAVGVPTHWELLAQTKDISSNALSELMCAITGGDKLATQTENDINTFFRSHGCKYSIQKGYGMTEMCSAVTFTQRDECNEPGSVGIPLCKNLVMVVEPGTEMELPYNTKGEICLTGPSMMLEYFGMPDETARTIKKHKDGTKWIHTGDIGYVTENGVVFIIDRIKRMIVRPDGHNVWPSQIEAVLAKHPAVRLSAVVGIKSNDSINGKIPTAFIVTNDNVKHTDSVLREIEAFTKEYLPERDTASDFRFIDELPLTSVGKVDYRALEQEAEK